MDDSRARMIVPGVGSILVVDDDAALRGTLTRALTRLGHHVMTCASLQAALDELDRSTFDLVITDLRLPEGSGLDLLAGVRQRWPDTRTILMSGLAQTEDAAVAIQHGVSHLLLKPFDLEELQSCVDKALAQVLDRSDGRTMADAMAVQRDAQSRMWVLRAAHALAAAVEAKDAYTAGHAARVTAYSLVIADCMGYDDVARLQLATDLHDVGKIGVPDAVLNKAGALTPDEFDEIKRHPAAGERILRPLIDDTVVLGVVRSHHERWDGLGYPDGLSGEMIPRGARIVAAADTLDAMTSARAYRDALPWDIAVSEILRCGGTQFDPAVIAAFAGSLPALEQLYHAAALHTR
ncbi:MAG: HD domain-containing phosphohydrolase [Gemmatimonadota bacterium]